jgi:(p)ppGpp synthase/HD superfamily hydrolase
MIRKARAFAEQKHRDQRRKHSDEPYFGHVESVVRILTAFGVDRPPVIAAAYLHDTVEDTDASIKDILTQFGEEVAELVYWLTDAEQSNRPMRRIVAEWRLGHAPLDAKIIKLADMIDNTEDICEHDRRFAPVYLREKAKLLEKMAQSEGEGLTELAIFKEARKIVSVSDAFRDHPSSARPILSH